MKTSQHVGLKGIDMKEEWLMSGAVVPVDAETTASLVAEIKRLIDVVGGLILKQEPVVFNTLTSLKHKKTVGPIESAMMSLPPAQRTWVGLTDDEVYKIAFTLEGEHWKKIADAIEAKLKEKNA